MNSKLTLLLNKRKEEGSFRELNFIGDKVDFYSNDYLGLAKIATSSDFHELYSGTGSRLISGSNKITEKVELKLAHHFKSETALIFNSGYDANLGFFSCVPQKGDTVIYDEFIHASIRDGLRLSNARSFSFDHNNPEDLEKKLRNSEGIVYVAIEGLYSMNGDMAPVRPIFDLCVRYGAFLIIDEAHSAGVFGKDGTGVADAFGIQPFAKVVTFGKAFGSHGGSILGSRDLINFLINFSRPFIYSTALPPESYIRIGEMIDHPLINYHRLLLQEKISLFRTGLKSNSLLSEVNSPIQIIQLGSVSKTKELAEKVQKENFAVKPIYSPTVPRGQEGLRICIHSFNDNQDIINLSELIKRHV